MLSRLLPDFRHPARLIVSGFGAATAIGTLLLLLPIATEAGASAGLVTALFTATSAVSVTGLVVVDTSTYWSGFGEAVILMLIQIGGVGVMTLASILGLIVARKMGLRMQLVAQSETKSLRLGETRRVVLGVIRISLVVEFVLALILTLRFVLRYDESWTHGAYLGLFHAVSAYNNAGFALWSDSLTRFAADPWMMVPIMAAIVIGGLGFPVLFEVGRSIRRRMVRRQVARTRWSLHTKITLITYGVVAVFAIVAVSAIEWNNSRTLGAYDWPHRILVGIFAGVSPRTAGFNSIDIGQMHPSALLITDVAMFIGGGSAGTAGGIKVTTFALLAFVVFAEVRGEPTVHVMGRRLAATVQRQAVTVLVLGLGAVGAGTIALMLISNMRLDEVLFEVVSAFATVGLSTGITADLPPAGQLLLVALMLLGRLGPITLASALALRNRERRYELPEERPIVG